jgi:hypothetical protein
VYQGKARSTTSVRYASPQGPNVRRVGCIPVAADLLPYGSPRSRGVKLYGPERGAHSRSAVGLAELPFNIPVEIEGEVELYA